jgi:succinoglycan biosynthesis protein ExoA
MKSSGSMYKSQREWDSVSDKAHQLVHTNDPVVSVIMPIRNEEAMIYSSLRSVLSQDYPGEKIEVIIVDGMSTDATRRIVLQLARADHRIHLIENENRTMATGFNKGLSIAKGNVIIMLGGHTELSSNYVRACCITLQNGLADCVGGTVNTVCDDREVSSVAIRLGLSCRFGLGGPAFRSRCTEPKYVDTVAFGAYTREIISRVGALDEDLVRNQDDEFNYRIRKLGGRILLIPEASCSYVPRSSLRLLWRQYYQYGLWKVRVLQKCPRQMRARHFVPGLFVVALLSSAVAVPFLHSAATVFVSLFCLYAISNVLASVAVTHNAGRYDVFPSVPLVFMTLHFAYGIGFLAGVFRFGNRFVSATV